MDYIMETVGLRKAYKDNIVVDDVNMHISKGAIYGFVGPNGADVGLAALAAHLVSQRDALGLSGQQDVKIRAFLEQLSGSSHRQLGVAQHDEGRNVHVVVHLADGQLTGQARDIQRISLSHIQRSPLLFRNQTGSFSPPRTWKCRCLTVWPASSPTLEMTR